MTFLFYVMLVCSAISVRRSVDGELFVGFFGVYYLQECKQGQFIYWTSKVQAIDYRQTCYFT